MLIVSTTICLSISHQIKYRHFVCGIFKFWCSCSTKKSGYGSIISLSSFARSITLKYLNK